MKHRINNTLSAVFFVILFTTIAACGSGVSPREFNEKIVANQRETAAKYQQFTDVLFTDSMVQRVDSAFFNFKEANSQALAEISALATPKYAENYHRAATLLFSYIDSIGTTDLRAMVDSLRANPISPDELELMQEQYAKISREVSRRETELVGFQQEFAKTVGASLQTTEGKQ